MKNDPPRRGERERLAMSVVSSLLSAILIACSTPASSIQTPYDPANDESLPALDADGSGPSGGQDKALGGTVPGAIQIDGPAATSTPGADLFPNVGTPVNTGATIDWVANSSATTAASLDRCIDDTGAPVNCAEPGVTIAPGGTGNWNGVRIVDGIAGSDQNIFLTGGKENDTSTWNIGPGSVGSSKYDITQAYLGNNQDTLFFGMERRGNNGTTAFDFEFNQAAPMSEPGCVQIATVPCRTVGDILFTFEMQGSGGSGSATPFVFEWDGDSFETWTPDPNDPSPPPSPVATINNATNTAGAPWGHVNSQGTWVAGALDRFTFAEAFADLDLLPGVDACGGRAFVQVRTRSSSTPTSDLKDTTSVFEFTFGSIEAAATTTPSCSQQFGYSASAVDQNQVAIPAARLGCAWTFTNGGGVSSLCSGSMSVPPGTYTGTVVVTDSQTGCSDDATSAAVNVYAPLATTATLAADCSSVLDVSYDATPTGGSGAFSYAWTFTGAGSPSPNSSTSKNGSLLVTTAGVDCNGHVVVTDGRSDLPGQCTASANGTARPYAPLHVDLGLIGSAPVCPAMSTDAVTYQPTNATGGSGSYGYLWTNPTCSGQTCTIDPANDAFCHSATLGLTLSDLNATITGCTATASELESYSKLTTINASDLP